MFSTCKTKNMKTLEFVIRSKKPAQYFKGHLIQYGNDWLIGCQSASGGSRKIGSILDILDYKATSKKALIASLQAFAKRWKLVFTFDKRKF